MHVKTPVIALALVGVVALAQEPRPSTSDPASLTRRDITAEAQRRLETIRADVRLFDAFPGPEPGEGAPHVLLAERPGLGLVSVRHPEDLLPLLVPIDTPARALALVRFLSAPPVGPPLIAVVDLAPRIETDEAVFVLSPVQVEALAGDLPRVSGDAETGFVVERVVVSLLSLATAREVPEPGKGELAPEQAQLLEGRGVTTHRLDVIGTVVERVGARGYEATLSGRPAQLLVVRVPREAAAK